jgi:hypothetical protein
MRTRTCTCDAKAVLVSLDTTLLEYIVDNVLVLILDTTVSIESRKCLLLARSKQR